MRAALSAPVAHTRCMPSLADSLRQKRRSPPSEEPLRRTRLSISMASLQPARAVNGGPGLLQASWACRSSAGRWATTAPCWLTLGRSAWRATSRTPTWLTVVRRPASSPCHNRAAALKSSNVHIIVDDTSHHDTSHRRHITSHSSRNAPFLFECVLRAAVRGNYVQLIRRGFGDDLMIMRRPLMHM